MLCYVWCVEVSIQQSLHCATMKTLMMPVSCLVSVWWLHTPFPKAVAQEATGCLCPTLALAMEGSSWPGSFDCYSIVSLYRLLLPSVAPRDMPSWSIGLGWDPESQSSGHIHVLDTSSGHDGDTHQRRAAPVSSARQCRLVEHGGSQGRHLAHPQPYLGTLKSRK